jgi:hypothetical protein
VNTDHDLQSAMRGRKASILRVILTKELHSADQLPPGILPGSLLPGSKPREVLPYLCSRCNLPLPLDIVFARAPASAFAAQSQVRLLTSSPSSPK